MNRSPRAAIGLLLWAVVCFAVPAAGQNAGQNNNNKDAPSIRRVHVLHNAGRVEIEIEASDRLVPRANVLTGPDRLVLDFVNAVPGTQLHNQAVNRGDVKSLRVGLFSANPPVTRVVVDLNGPQPYQVFPSGRTVIVKIGGSAGVQASGFHPSSGPVLVNTNYAAQPVLSSLAQRTVVRPPLEVSFENGLLSISSNKASLSEVLFAIHQRTGAEIAIPAGAEQEQVVAEIGPAPAPEALSRLLNGSKFNFLILSSPGDSGALDRVILSSRPEGPMPPPRPQPVVSAEDEEAEIQAKTPSAGPPPPASEKANSPTDRPSASPDAPKPTAGDTDIPD